MYLWVGGGRINERIHCVWPSSCLLLTALCVCVHLCVTGSVESTDVLKVGQQIYWYLYMLYMQ